MEKFRVYGVLWVAAALFAAGLATYGLPPFRMQGGQSGTGEPGIAGAVAGRIVVSI
jgi:hypothetical protein